MTTRERKIIERLANGERLIRPEGARFFRWHDATGEKFERPYVTSALAHKMFSNGLLEVTCPHGESRTRYVPTAFALAAIAEPRRAERG